jgi:hypothetical protein
MVCLGLYFSLLLYVRTVDVEPIIEKRGMPLDFGEYNPNFKMNEPCNQYDGCFLCTLANCEWTGSGCEGPDQREIVNWKTITEKGQTCGDPLDLCKVSKEEKFIGSTAAWNLESSKTDIIPAGYFCQMKLELEDDHFGYVPTNLINYSDLNFEQGFRALLGIETADSASTLLNYALKIATPINNHEFSDWQPETPLDPPPGFNKKIERVNYPELNLRWGLPEEDYFFWTVFGFEEFWPGRIAANFYHITFINAIERRLDSGDETKIEIVNGFETINAEYIFDRKNKNRSNRKS